MGEQTTEQLAGARWRRVTRKGWLAVTIVGVVLVGAALAISPVVIANAEMSNAQAEFDLAAAELDSVRADYADAADVFAERVNAAKVEYQLLRDAEAALSVDLVDSAPDRDAFLQARAVFLEATGLELDDLGAVAESQTGQAFAVAPTPTAEDTASELREQSASVLSDAADAGLAADDLRLATNVIDERLGGVISSLDILRAAAYRKGLTIAFEKAGDPEKAALTASVIALLPSDGGDAPPPSLKEAVALLQSYAKSYTTAKNSHDVTVAAELKAAEEADQQRRAAERASEYSGVDANSSQIESGQPGLPRRTEAEWRASRPRGEIIRTDFPCTDGGGSSVSSSWWSFNPAPIAADAVWVEFENRGVNWGIRWTCPAQ